LTYVLESDLSIVAWLYSSIKYIYLED